MRNEEAKGSRISLFSKLAALFAPAATSATPTGKEGIVADDPPQPRCGQRHDIPAQFDPAVNADILSGMTFCATMQMRTPLRVLARHGEVHAGRGEPPDIAREQWEGIWVPRLKTWAELGIDLREAPTSTMASEVGQIPQDGGDYLKFLIAIRTVVEGDGSVAERRVCLNDELHDAQWSGFVSKLGGKSRVLDRLFPSFLSTISGLSEETRSVLRKMGLKTPANLKQSDDANLLKVPGIGPAKLKPIRSSCTSVNDQNAEFLEDVVR